jgi:hypothetical protein
VTVLIRGRIALKHTTLTTASSWSIVSVIIWAVCWTVEGMLPQMSEGLADRLWYATAVLALCPPMSVLGARRPTTRVWQWFVVLPMILVLASPLVSSWRELGDPSRLQLETPVLIGFGLVMVMSAGNYIGTRFTLSAVLLIIAVTMLVATLAEAVPDQLVKPYRLRLWATALLSVAVLIGYRSAIRQSRRTLASAVKHGAFESRVEGADRLWADFRNTFGIVWARRLQDRINGVATKEEWPARLESQGFVWHDAAVAPVGGESAGGGSPADERTEEAAVRIEHTLRWLLRRFCDPQWIDERLGTTLEVPVENVQSDPEY